MTIEKTDKLVTKKYLIGFLIDFIFCMLPRK